MALEDEEKSKSRWSVKWFLDSRCSRHMTEDPNNFLELKPNDGGFVTFGDNAKGKIIGARKIGIAYSTIIENVLLVDGLKHKLTM